MDTTQNDTSTPETQAQVERLGTASVPRLVLEFAIPSIIGMVVNGLYNIIDAIFMGHGVGAAGLATATVAGPAMIFSMAIGMLIGAGGNALVALKLGEGKHDEAERVLGNAFTLTLIAAAACTILINIFMDPVLEFSGATADIWSYSHDFMRIISVGFILQFFGMGFNNFMRTAGAPGLALGTMVAGTIVCIILNYLFVMVLGLGIAGSAWATVIGQGLSAALVFWYFVFYKKAPFRIRLSCMGLRPGLVRTILALGSASFVLQIANTVINLIINNQLVIYGTLDVIGSEGALAAIGVVQRIAMFALFPIFGVAIAAQPLFGFNFGAQNFRRVQTVFKVSFIWVTAIGIFFWLLVHLFPNQIIGVFGVRSDLLNFTVAALQVQMFFMPLVGLQIIAVNYFQSSGQPLKSMFLTLTRQLLYLIPLVWGLPLLAQTFPELLGITPLQTLYHCFPIADCLSVVTAGLMTIIEFRKLNIRIREHNQSVAAI
ncbi:MAG: MATE family efflux transporter [Coriobacteriales bacterium]|jgi:putative MATE family efflux protein|nr:MATE family efflux transporter [Coriobacteriales bacterium]